MILILVACGKKENAKAVPSIMKLPVSLSEQTSTLTDSDGDGISDASDPMPHVVEHSSNRFNNKAVIQLLDQKGDVIETVPLLRKQGDGQDDLLLHLPEYLRQILAQSLSQRSLKKSNKLVLTFLSSESIDTECVLDILMISKNRRELLTARKIDCAEFSKEQGVAIEIEKDLFLEMLNGEVVFAINFEKKLTDGIFEKIYDKNHDMLFWVISESNYEQELDYFFKEKELSVEYFEAKVVEHKTISLENGFFFKHKKSDEKSRLYFRIIRNELTRKIITERHPYTRKCSGHTRFMEKINRSVSPWEVKDVAFLGLDSIGKTGADIALIAEGVFELDLREDEIQITSKETNHQNVMEYVSSYNRDCDASFSQKKRDPLSRVEFFIEYWVVE